MEKIAGPYAHTLAGVLGDKRSTMLDSELQYTVRITIAVIIMISAVTIRR